MFGNVDCCLLYAGHQPKSAVAVVTVMVEDLNDNAPRFSNVENGVIRGYVYENKDNNSLIVHVTATDADEGDNSRVSYSIVGGEIGLHYC